MFFTITHKIGHILFLLQSLMSVFEVVYVFRLCLCCISMEKHMTVLLKHICW